MATQPLETRFEEVERLRLLVEASEILLGSLELDAVLPQVLELARRTLLADAYALWQFDNELGVWTIATHDGLSKSYVEAAPQAVRGNAAEVSFDEPIVVEDVPGTDWLTPEHREAHREEGTTAFLAVVLRHRETVLGTLVFYYRKPHVFTDAEKSAATTLANLASAAIATARVYDAQSRMVEERSFLLEASELLASSLDYETTLRNVAALAVPRFADWCTIDMVTEDGSIRRLTVAHVDPAKVLWADVLADQFKADPNAPYGVPNVIRTRKSELMSEIPDELLVEATHNDPELLEILRELGLRSSMCVPLVARDRVLGAITFVSAESGRHFDDSDLATAEELARRAALAVDNATLYREALGVAASLDTLLATAPIGIGFWDRDLRYVRINPALAEINGLPVEEHLGRTLGEVLPELAETLEPLWRRILATGEPVLDIEITGATPASPGIIRHWLASYYPVKNPAGEILGIGAVVAETTEREQARAAAEAARERLAVLAEASTSFASTLDYEQTLANIASLLVPRYADWYAADVMDESGAFRRIAVVHADPDKAEWAAKSQREYVSDPNEPEGTGRVVRTGEPVLYRRITDELLAGSTRDAEHHEILRRLGMESAMVVPLTAGGRTFGALMLVSSNPERLYDEADLDFAQHLARRAAVAVDNARLYDAAEERGRAALVVEHVGDGVFLLDQLGVIRLWNPAAARITGLAAAEVLGRPAEAVFSTWDLLAPLAKEGTAAQTWPVEVGGHELWLSVTGVSFEGATVYAFRDLTEERAVERLKTDFVSTVSHELRTPLAAIYGAALTLRRDDVQLSEPQRSGLLEVIASESDRLARIVNDILWASRLESGTMTTTVSSCDGVHLARGVVEAARHYIPPNIVLSFDAPEDAPPIAADPDKVRQVLTNLVDNAVKYSPEGGRVDVRVSVEGERLRFRVQDEGLGIPPTEQARIFEKFYRLDPNLTRGVGGTGLGLYISQELVERMSGRIWVDSAGAGGSTFWVDLPLAT